MTQPSALPFLRQREGLEGVSVMPPVDFSSIHSFGRIISAYESPSQTSIAERVFTFGLVFARQPARVLEIGFKFGGTSFLMLCALADAGGGRLVALDPNPEPALDFSSFGDRFQLVRGRSPEDLPAAIAALGGPADLCHLDANHGYEPVLADLEALLPHMAAESYILLHDAMWPEVRQAVDRFLGRHSPDVVDCGVIAPSSNALGYAGLRLLRIRGAEPGPGG